MAILKCKMCGGDIELSADKTFGTCEFCGSTMTFPKVDDEQRAAAFNRGNHFRRTGEFDKALAVYERIVQEDENDAEAHWCCALCRFGIEYVEDPNTLEYLPTCHRASFDSFLEDVDYLAALEHSDGITRRQYQKDAAKIAEVQRGILATSQNEEPFDVFLCYKETEDDGSRTRDSLYAQDIYYQLTEQGRRVFFSRITLEDKAGTEYEPYIFAALNSAKVMVLVTTSAEHANAVWVKNEWSRFLSLMRKDRTKLLLPCYRDMDPYDLPEALSVLQSYDMSKIGFIQDLTRGINKVLDGAKPKQTAKETVVIQQQSGYAAPLLERAFLFLEDGDWAKADDFCEQVLNLEPKNALAYLGKLMAELKVSKREELRDQPLPFHDCNNYEKALRFADDKLKSELTDVITYIFNRNEIARKEGIYQDAIATMDRGEVADCREAARLFETISDYRDSAQKAQECREQAVIIPKENAYRAAVALMANGYENDFRHAAEQFRKLSGYKDAEAKVQECQDKAEIARKEDIYNTSKQVLGEGRSPSPESCFNAIKGFESIADYKDSSELAKQCREKLYALLTNELETSTDVERLTRVSEFFVKMGDYKEARDKSQACLSKQKDISLSDAVTWMNSAGASLDVLETALYRFQRLSGWRDADQLAETCRRRIEQIKAQEETARQEAERKAEEARLEAERKAEAERRAEIKKKKRQRAFVILFVILGSLAVAAFLYWNNVIKPQQAYDQAMELYSAGKYEEAIVAFESLNGHKNSAVQIMKCETAIQDEKYTAAVELYTAGKYEEAITAFTALDGYKDSAAMIKEIKPKYYTQMLSTANVGSTVFFGSYEQDGNTSNGKEDIKWIVLAKESDRILVISNQALDCMSFNTNHTAFTWENCSLREWLNGSFLNDAFSTAEQKMILNTRVTADKNPSYSTSPGKNTTDKVFLLSIAEANKYFNSNDDRACTPTQYAIIQGAKTQSYFNIKLCWWWLRSPGYDSNHAALVGCYGSLIYDNSFGGDNYGIAVRPAMWISIGD